MTRLQIFALVSLLTGILIMSYFIMFSKYEIITVFQNANKEVMQIANTNKRRKIVDTAEKSIQRAQNFTNINIVSTTQVHNKYLMPTTKVSANGRILVTFYREQQIGAAMSMFSLQKWATTVGAFVVEPFVENSTFTLPTVTSAQQLTHHLRFRDYFNIDIWTNMSTEKNVIPLISWNDFVNQVPKKFIFVMILKSYTKRRGQYLLMMKLYNKQFAMMLMSPS